MVADDVRTAHWHGAGYARHSSHHRSYDDWFLDRHPPAPGDVVVDLGCGSGEFSARLASLVGDGRVIGVDRDPSMLEHARTHTAPNLTFVEASADEVDTVVEPGTIDLVVSRAMLHWLPVSRYPSVFGAVYRVLRPGGWYHSESGGAGNVGAATGILYDIAAERGLPLVDPFPHAGEAFDLVEAAGFEIPDEGVRTVAQRRPFSREDTVGFLRTQVAVALTRLAPPEERPAIADEVVAAAERLRRHDGTYDQTFVRLEILARRPV